MTNEELEREIGHLATKEDLALLRGDTKAETALLRSDMAKLEASLLKQIIASERAQRIWIWGLYALIIVSFFVRH